MLNIADILFIISSGKLTWRWHVAVSVIGKLHNQGLKLSQADSFNLWGPSYAYMCK